MGSVRALEIEDLPALRAHFERHFDESGAGEPAFAPFSRHAPIDFEAWQARAELQLLLPLRIPSWRRSWGLFEGDRVVGHIELTGPELAVDLHRARLGVGVERDHRGRGDGRALMHAAIEWARAEASLSWIDLDVFEHSGAALRLYGKLGFEVVGRTPDRHRIDGVHVTEVSMALRVE